MTDKLALRRQLRAARRAHVASLPTTIKALLFMRPPAAIIDQYLPGTERGTARSVGEGHLPPFANPATIALYVARPDEAPTLAYTRWFAEQGHTLALPWFATATAPMEFRRWANPLVDDGLVPGPYGTQPPPDAAAAIPTLLFVPLLGFTADGHRLGQGGGHYDQWLAAHRAIPAIGLAWDCQCVDTLPVEPHDIPLAGIITPTRFYDTRANPGTVH